MASEIYSNVCTSSERHRLFFVLGNIHYGSSGSPETADCGWEGLILLHVRPG